MNPTDAPSLDPPIVDNTGFGVGILNSTVFQPLTNQFSVSNITSFISFIIGASVAFVFLWWGVRKAWRAIVSATTRGKGKI